MFIIIIGLLSFVVMIISLRNFSRGVALWLSLIPVVWSLNPPIGIDILSILRMQQILLTCIWIYAIRSKKLILPKTKIIKSYVWFLIACFISSIFSPGGLHSILRTVTYVEPLLWFCFAASIVYTSEKYFHELMLGLVSGLIIVALYGLYEFLFQSNPLMESGLLHLSEHYLDDIRFGGSGRISSTIGQPVYTAAYFLILIPIAFFYQKYLTNSKMLKLIIWGLLLLSIFLLFFTGTRAAYLTVIVMIVTFLICSSFLRKNLVRTTFLGLIFAGVIYYFLPEDFYQFFQNSFIVDGSSQREATNLVFRINLTGELFKYFLAHPLLGLGPGYINRTASLPILSEFKGLEGQENHYLMILADSGIIGALTYLFFLVTVVKAIRRGMSMVDEVAREYATLLLILFVGIFFFSISAMMLNSTIMHILLILLGINVAFIEKKEALSRIT